MGATAIVAGVLAKIEELLDVDMPGFQIGADRALALAALIDRDRRVVGNLQERHDALALAIGALDMGTEPAHRRPVIAETARIFGEKRIVLHRLEDAAEIVGDRCQETGGKLRPLRPGVEEGRRRGHEAEARQKVIELDRPRLAIDFAQRQPHGDAHKEHLRQFESDAAGLKDIAIVKGLKPKELEIEIALGLQGGGDPGRIEALEFRIEKSRGNALFKIGREGLGVERRHIALGCSRRRPGQKGQRFGAKPVQQEPCRGEGIVRLGLDQRARRHDRRFGKLGKGDAVIEIAARLAEDRFGFDALETVGGFRNDDRKPRLVERACRAIRLANGYRRNRCHQRLGLASLRMRLAIKDIGARHLVMARAHQHQLDLILDVLDM